MKPLYIGLVMYALAITALADALEAAFGSILPGVGLVIGIPLAVCINITMGAGLVLALWLNDMFHPTFGPFGVTAGAIPGIDSLPIWLGLVIAGIVYKMQIEKSAVTKAIPSIAKTAAGISLENPMSIVKGARDISHTLEHLPKATPTLNTDIKPYAQNA
jgi:hypothetical protein